MNDLEYLNHLSILDQCAEPHRSCLQSFVHCITYKRKICASKSRNLSCIYLTCLPAKHYGWNFENLFKNYEVLFLFQFTEIWFNKSHFLVRIDKINYYFGKIIMCSKYFCRFKRQFWLIIFWQNLEIPAIVNAMLSGQGIHSV